MFRCSAGVVLTAIIALSATGCIVRNGKNVVKPVELPTRPVQSVVETPVKAHLFDGHSVTFPGGVTFEGQYVVGRGTRWDLLLELVGPVDRISIDSIAGMETFTTGVDAATSVLLTVPALALGAVGVAGLSVAIFGSCPTFYAADGDSTYLQAEGFSYSIAPLLESRDVDRVMLRPDSGGRLSIEVRNEALETHRVNHLELLEIRHRPSEMVVPDQDGSPIVVDNLQVPHRAADRAGRDVRTQLRRADGLIFETAPQTLQAAHLGDLHDHIDLVFPKPMGADSAALMMKTRNSLLTTILLYDVMLRSAGPSALDWLGTELNQVGTALELGSWYTRQMGLHVQVWRNGAFEQVARISETGPIAWKDLAVIIPVDAASDSLRVRLRFVADNWRIDTVALATAVRRPDITVLPVTSITLADGTVQPAALTAVAESDESYLTTMPGQRYGVGFSSTLPAGADRTYLLASQGYYTEWMRQEWLRGPGNPDNLRPSDDLLLASIERWRTRKPTFEQEFYASRIPVR